MFVLVIFLLAKLLIIFHTCTRNNMFHNINSAKALQNTANHLLINANQYSIAFFAISKKPFAMFRR